MKNKIISLSHLRELITSKESIGIPLGGSVMHIWELDNKYSICGLSLIKKHGGWLSPNKV